MFEVFFCEVKLKISVSALVQPVKIKDVPVMMKTTALNDCVESYVTVRGAEV